MCKLNQFEFNNPIDIGETFEQSKYCVALMRIDSRYDGLFACMRQIASYSGGVAYTIRTKLRLTYKRNK